MEVSVVQAVAYVDLHMGHAVLLPHMKQFTVLARSDLEEKVSVTVLLPCS